MDCYKIRDLFGEYIEHQLNEEELKNFEKHMEECSDCRNEFYKFEKMIFRLKSIKDIEPPKELKDKIMKKVVSEENKKLNAKIINFRKYSSIAATLLIIVFSVIYYQAYLIKTRNLNEQKNTTIISLETTNEDNNLQFKQSDIKESEAKISTFNTTENTKINTKEIEKNDIPQKNPTNIMQNNTKIVEEKNINDEVSKSIQDNNKKALQQSNIPQSDTIGIQQNSIQQDKTNNPKMDKMIPKDSITQNEIRNNSINFYEEGINVDILTSDVEKFKNLLLDSLQNGDESDSKSVNIFEDNPNYIEVVLDKNQFEELEKSFSNIGDYTIYINNLDEVSKNINNIIDNGIITEKGLIKFKINIKEDK